MSRSRKASRKRSRSRSRKSRDKKLGRFRHPLIRFLVLAGLGALFIAVLVVAMILLQYDRRAARYDIDTVGRIPMETQVLDATGELIGYLHGEDVGTPVPLESVSPYFIQALIAREDTRFYRHDGIDRIGVVRAWLRIWL